MNGLRRGGLAGLSDALLDNLLIGGGRGNELRDRADVEVCPGAQDLRDDRSRRAGLDNVGDADLDQACECLERANACFT